MKILSIIALILVISACKEESPNTYNQPYIDTYKVVSLQFLEYQNDSLIRDSIAYLNEQLRLELEFKDNSDSSVFNPATYQKGTSGFGPINYLILANCQDESPSGETSVYWDADVAGSRIFFWGINPSGESHVQVCTILSESGEEMILFFVEEESGIRSEQLLRLKKP